MPLNSIIKVAIDIPLRTLFDYLPCNDEVLQRGQRVMVPFGKKTVMGIVMRIDNQTSLSIDALKPIQQVCESYPLFPDSLCQFFEKVAQYYHHPIGEVAFSSLPTALRQGKACSLEDPTSASIHNGLVLNDEQQLVLKKILAPSEKTAFLLQGITGSGKTEIYLEACAQQILNGKQVLMLIPEISLTPQTANRFIARFGESVSLFHSQMTPTKRLQTWMNVRSHKAHVVVGTRSSLFLPFMNLGLIIVDEEHDLSFKQQEGLRYSARDMAVLRAQLAQGKVILGSATPSVESTVNAQNQKYEWLFLNRRINDNLPKITLLDIRHNQLNAGISNALMANIEAELKKGGQVLLFINRRGFAPVMMCYDCTWFAECKRCDARLTYHQAKAVLICHHCTHTQKLPLCCPQCQSKEIHPLGQGTERLEEYLQAKFPDYAIARIDSDVTRKKGSLETLLDKARNHEAQILIGTQILAKGHHFPHLSMVAILDADGGLFSIDFRAIERMAQLIIQVAGRAGRAHTAGEVFIQTFHPEHPLLKLLLQQDYKAIVEELILERQKAQLPPFSHLALIRAQATQPEQVESVLQAMQAQLKQINPHVKVLGPVTAPMHKRQGQYRFQLLIQAPQRAPLHHLLQNAREWLENSKPAKKVRWSIDVDPLEMY